MKLSIREARLFVDLEGLEKVWALKRGLSLPLADIAAVTAEEPGDKPRNYWRALRFPGTFLPWVIKAGTYYTAEGWEFWYVTSGKGFLVLDLSAGPYQRVVLGLDDAAAWARRISEAAKTEGA
ncbi:MAG: hypothetical protein WD645_00430 [Dehalococcoidia bacterium]